MLSAREFSIAWVRQSSGPVGASELIPALSEIFPYPNHVVSPPRSVDTQVRGSQITITRPQPVKEKMLGYTHLEALPHINAKSPGSLPADGIERPGIECLWNIFPEHKPRLREQEEPAQLAAPEWTNLHVARQHIAAERIARSIDPAEVSGISQT